jgi:hypothetical protein
LSIKISLRDLHSIGEKQLEVSNGSVGHAKATWKASRAQQGSVTLHVSITCIIFKESLVFWSIAAASVSSYTSSAILMV